MMIYQAVFAELQPRATRPSTRQVIKDCLQTVGKLPQSRIFEAEEPVALALEQYGEDDPQLLREEAILNVCGACTHEESLLGKVDDMLYAIGMFENNERDEILDRVLNHTLGWYSHEWGVGRR